MNGERGTDPRTDFQRARVVITITNEKTCLLRNNKTKDFLFIESATEIEDHTNYHLHILFPDKDSTTGRRGFAIKGLWAIESLQTRTWRDGEFVGPYIKPVVFNPEIHSKYCYRILASTENLMGFNSDWDKSNIEQYPELDNTKIKDVYNICNSLVEEYVKFQGKLEYVMIHPFYGILSDIIIDGNPHILVEYKKDENDFIAVFPAIAYNKAKLINQLY
jgi:hypothetical protein